ncbi:MAG: phosphotransferase family protein [Acidimicrobiia bacterium]|nr:phosphotransferase family protein [Acidimicrobiia bacterium]
MTAEDTAPIREEERFDEDRVAAYLHEHLPDVVGGAEIEFRQFPGGKANLTYLARAGDTELVLRRPPLGETAPGAHDMHREHTVLSVLHRAYPEAPRAYLYCEDPSVMGKPFFVMERRTGHVIREEWPDDLPDTPGWRRELAGSVVDALADLHLVDYEELGLADLGRPDGFVARQVRGWTDRWRRAMTEDVPAMETLADRLADDVPEPQAAVLLHNDYKLDNVMVDADATVVAVFDWDMATLGDPLVDLGTAVAYWAGPGDVLYPLFGDQGHTLAPDMPASEVVERYAERTGFTVEHIAYYRAFAMFRIAVIVQQLHARWRRGETSDDRFAPLGAMVPPIAEVALDLG